MLFLVGLAQATCEPPDLACIVHGPPASHSERLAKACVAVQHGDTEARRA